MCFIPMFYSCFQVVRTFFRTNRVTCQDWLRTMRPIAATAASNVGQHAVAIRHGLEMIKDLINKGNTQVISFVSEFNNYRVQ